MTKTATRHIVLSAFLYDMQLTLDVTNRCMWVTIDAPGVKETSCYKFFHRLGSTLAYKNIALFNGEGIDFPSMPVHYSTPVELREALARLENVTRAKLEVEAGKLMTEQVLEEIAQEHWV